MPAPGDIRNVIAALADAEPMLIDLFQHRFKDGNGLSGHSMGNLLLAAMTSISGDFYNGIKEISRVLKVKGNIYPIANQNVVLHAEMTDGEIVTGKYNIPLANKQIKRVFVSPLPVKPLPDAIEAIKQADLIVISPGSLYTSVMPNLIVPEIENALRDAPGKVVYVCNVMTQYGETTGYTAGDHIQAIHDHIGADIVSTIVVNNSQIEQDIRENYAEEHAEPVVYDISRLKSLGLEVVEADIIDHDQRKLRHDTHKIAKLLYAML